MKRCPTCGSSYTDDTLVYCLQDGATLLSVSDSQAGFDPEATMRISASEGGASPTDFRPQGAPTHRQSPTPLTAPPRTPTRTSDHQEPRAGASPGKSTSPVIVAGITAIVVLLLVIAGIGIAILVRSPGGSASTGNNNRAGNRESGGNASNTTANNKSSERAVNNSNTANANDAGRNSSASEGAAGRAEAKVVRGSLLEESDLLTLSREELRRLRNTVYARHGRTFDSEDLQRYFNSRSWYRPRSDYDEASLTETDRANIRLIQTIENSRA